jgi:hypothetical protein
VYAVGLASLERRVESERQVAGMVVAMGGEASYPSMVEAQAEFDAWLRSPLQTITSDEDEWRQVMGVPA